MEVYVDDETKLTLHGLQQHYVKLKENEKNKKLFELLDVLEFNQVVIFVKSVQRCMALAQLLTEQNFPAIGIHRGMGQEERLSRYQQFKDFQKVKRSNLFSLRKNIWHSISARHIISTRCTSTFYEFCINLDVILSLSAYFGRHQLVRSWYGYWACQHRIQLRYARRLRHLLASCRSCWAFRYQRVGHHIRFGRVSHTLIYIFSQLEAPI